VTRSRLRIACKHGNEAWLMGFQYGSSLATTVGMKQRLPLTATVLRSLVVALLCASAAAAQNPEVALNTVGTEALGRAWWYSVNYERSLLPRISAGIGGAVWTNGGRTAIVTPVHVSWQPVGHRNSIYLSVGATVGRGTNTVAWGTTTMGYQHKTRRGFVLRPTVTFLYEDKQSSAIWPGFFVGQTF